MELSQVYRLRWRMGLFETMCEFVKKPDSSRKEAVEMACSTRCDGNGSSVNR